MPTMAANKAGLVPVTPAEVLYCSQDIAFIQFQHGNSIPICAQPQTNAVTIMETLTEFLTSGHLLDATIKDDVRTYKIHLLVLTANSPKHRELFVARGSQPGSNGETITVTGLQTGECLGHVLEFLYTGHLVLTKTTVEDAFKIAEQLDLPLVFDQCQKFLQCYDTTSALDYLQLAIRYKCDHVSQELAKYIRRYPELSLESKDFLNIDAADVWLAILGTPEESSVNELNVFENVIKWILHKKEDRKPQATELLTKITWKSIPVPNLTSVLDAHGDLFESEECKNILYEAFKYHALRAVEEGYEPKVADWKNAPFFGSSP